MSKHRIEGLPIIIPVGSKKITLSLNWYRNADYYELNKAKKTYLNILRYTARKKEFKKYDTVSLHYIFNFKQKGKDLGIFLSVIDKFVSDYLVVMGILIDDSYPYVKEVKGSLGNRGDDTVDVIINEIL